MCTSVLAGLQQDRCQAEGSEVFIGVDPGRFGAEQVRLQPECLGNRLLGQGFAGASGHALPAVSSARSAPAIAAATSLWMAKTFSAESSRSQDSARRWAS